MPSTVATPIAVTEPATPQASSGPHRINPVQIMTFPVRAFLALGWTRAATEKLIDARWWDGTFVRDFLIRQHEFDLPFMSPFEHLGGTRIAVVVSLVVLVAEVAIGFFLLANRHLVVTLSVACFLNVTFVALGAVTPSAFYLVMQMTLLFSMYLRRHNTSARGELAVIAVLLVTAVVLAPFIRTLHPHQVIEDPAVMLTTLAILTAATLTIIRVDRAARTDQRAKLNLDLIQQPRHRRPNLDTTRAPSRQQSNLDHR